MLPLLSHKLRHNVFCPCRRLAYRSLAYSIIHVMDVYIQHNMNRLPISNDSGTQTGFAGGPKTLTGQLGLVFGAACQNIQL